MQLGGLRCSKLFVRGENDRDGSWRNFSAERQGLVRGQGSTFLPLLGSRALCTMVQLRRSMGHSCTLYLFDHLGASSPVVSIFWGYSQVKCQDVCSIIFSELHIFCTCSVYPMVPWQVP